jgi:hypothetical protein
MHAAKTLKIVTYFMATLIHILNKKAFRTDKKKMRDLPKVLHFFGTSADSRN